jgi:hypothetical protein
MTYLSIVVYMVIQTIFLTHNRMQKIKINLHRCHICVKNSSYTGVDNTASSFMLTNKYYVHGHGNLTAAEVQEISYSEPDNFCSDSVADLKHVLSSDLIESCCQLFPMQMICLKGHPL